MRSRILKSCYAIKVNLYGNLKMISDEKLKEMKEVFTKISKRKIDPHEKIYAEIEENGIFDTEQFLQKLKIAANYDGPERRKRS